MKFVIHFKPIIFMVIIYCNKELTYVRINHLLNNVNFKLNKNANNHLVFDLYFDFPKIFDMIDKLLLTIAKTMVKLIHLNPEWLSHFGEWSASFFFVANEIFVIYYMSSVTYIKCHSTLSYWNLYVAWNTATFIIE